MRSGLPTENVLLLYARCMDPATNGVIVVYILYELQQAAHYNRQLPRAGVRAAGGLADAR